MQMRILLMQGVPVEKAVEAVPIPIPTARKIQAWLKSNPGRDWVKRNHPEFVGQSPERTVVEMKPTELQDAGPAVLGPPVASSLLGEVPGTAEPILENPEEGPEAEPQEPAPPVVPAPRTSPRPQMVIVREGQGGGMQIIGRPGIAGTARQPQQRLAPPSFQGSGVFGSEEEQIRMESPPAGIKGRGTINITPMTLLWYDYVRAEGYPEDIPTFIEECTVGYFASKGKKFVMVTDPMMGQGVAAAYLASQQGVQG